MDILTSIICTCKIYGIIIRNIIIFIGIYENISINLLFQGENTVAKTLSHARTDSHVTPDPRVKNYNKKLSALNYKSGLLTNERLLKTSKSMIC